jgi:YD repeat-containing protein
LQHQYTYAYDANGNSIESKSFGRYNVLRWLYTQTYDVNGNRIESKYFDNNNVLQYRDTLTYDANGNLTEDKSYDDNDALNRSYVYTVSPISGWARILGSNDDDDD